MRNLQRTVIVIVLSALLSAGLWAGTPAAAQAAKPSFNKALIISDKQFYDARAMNEQQIKKFISDKGRNCRSTKSKTCLKDIVTPATTLTSNKKGKGCKNIRIGSRARAWTVVNQVAKACNLSPKVLLTTIQKESSGVTKPQTSARWNKMMGMGCPDGGSCARKYSGFAKQLYYAADSLRAYGSQSSYLAINAFKKKTLYRSLDGHRFRIKNIATASLYTYTPHVSSNRLFFQVWTGFFGR